MRAVWEWLKKYWQIVVGVLLALLGVAFGVEVQRRRSPVQEPNPVEDEANEEAEAEAREAENQAADDKAEAQKEHDADIAVGLDKLQDTTVAIEHDTEKTNQYLQDVSKAVRGTE